MPAATDDPEAGPGASAWPPPWPAPGSDLARQFETVLGVTVPTDPGTVDPMPPPAPSLERERTTRPAAQATLPPPAVPAAAPGPSAAAPVAPPASPRPVPGAGAIPGAPSPHQVSPPGPPPRPRTTPAPFSPEWPPALATRHCPVGHPNPPSATSCRACGTGIEDLAVRVIDRPVLGELHLEDGTVVALDEPLLLGRNPVDDHLVFGRTARPVRLPDPRGELSRNHLEVRAVQWQVQVVDRRSTNGSVVRSSDGTVRSCPPDVPVELVPGAAVILGGGVTLEFRAAPA